MNAGDATVFVVDDDYSIRRSLKRLLESAAFDVETFSSADDFLSYRRRDAPGCLVLDVRMPGFGGLALQRHMVKAGSEIPIIFITAYANGEVEARAREAGAAAFLIKPLDDEILLGAVRGALGIEKEETS